ncbi:TetR/AcrR family transcriptional regulator [Marinigracilibium pacificum]|uniref:TetR/AcrR family transcriptional regulator n=1 Tax=Marinigracilibium pacificum TaxID=2729599 RepID=A0A848J1Y3_9BACT|nr:TetR/AcrR family transcriptional regulator [Marinigracilibium pacificum]NMM50833.1 TetR/AcrR family transcriptional regulator [Marinigracilibium pacificum]
MKEQIIQEANNLIVERGFNAFSYKTITEKVNIKTSSIHYHFPTKTDLGIAVVKLHSQALQQTIDRNKNKSALDKLDKLLSYFKKLAHNNEVCIVGAMTSDINTLEEPLRLEILNHAKAVINWAGSIITEGINQGIFKPQDNVGLNAKLLITNLMALLQIARIENNKSSFDLALKQLKNNLLM